MSPSVRCIGKVERELLQPVLVALSAKGTENMKKGARTS